MILAILGPNMIDLIHNDPYATYQARCREKKVFCSYWCCKGGEIAVKNRKKSNSNSNRCSQIGGMGLAWSGYVWYSRAKGLKKNNSNFKLHVFLGGCLLIYNPGSQVWNLCKVLQCFMFFQFPLYCAFAIVYPRRLARFGCFIFLNSII